MYSYFDWLIGKLLAHSLHVEFNDDSADVTEREITEISRNFFDKVAIILIKNAFEDERIVEAVLKLARIQRILVAFHIIGEMRLAEMAFFLDCDLNSIYVQKSDALRRLKKELAEIE